MAGMKEGGTYTVLVGRHEGRNHLEDPGVDGRIILKRIFKKWDREAGTRSNWLRIETGRGLL